MAVMPTRSDALAQPWDARFATVGSAKLTLIFASAFYIALNKFAFFAINILFPFVVWIPSPLLGE